jgi:energy-coupling factor transporter ATP-binding protein EcfA2
LKQAETLPEYQEPSTDETNRPPQHAERETHAETLIRLACEAELWHCEDEAWATFAEDSHWEHWPVDSTRFRAWLARRFHIIRGTSPSTNTLQEALAVVRGRALYDGPAHRVFTRVAVWDGRLYLDLCNDTWQAVEVDVHGWRIVNRPPVRFRRTRGMLPLPEPVPGGSIEELRQFIHVSPSGWPLIVGWLLGAFNPEGTFPILILFGSQGSGKSTAARMLRGLIDPNLAPERSQPRDERDLLVTAKNAWLLSIGNLSGLPVWLSDALCRLSSGAGFSTRELYTDTEEVVFAERRPIILNGIVQPATRADLLDRALLIELLPIADTERQPEAELWQQFQEAQPRILGALLEGVSHALASRTTIRLPSLPRLADFTQWAAAGIEALGIPRDEFLDHLFHLRETAYAEALEGDPVGEVLRGFLTTQTEGSWEGTATELLEQLQQFTAETSGPRAALPRTGRGIRSAVERLAPALRGVGFHVVFQRVGRTRTRIIRLTRIGHADGCGRSADDADGLRTVVLPSPSLGGCS